MSTIEDRVEESLNYLNGSKEHFREILLNKDELLAQMCDYAARIAERKRCEPWSVIMKITGHGSGMSSAIYAVYRRQEDQDAKG